MMEATIEPICLYEALSKIAHGLKGKTSPEDDSAHLKFKLPEYHILPPITEKTKEYF